MVEQTNVAMGYGKLKKLINKSIYLKIMLPVTVDYNKYSDLPHFMIFVLNLKTEGKSIANETYLKKLTSIFDCYFCPICNGIS